MAPEIQATTVGKLLSALLICGTHQFAFAADELLDLLSGQGTAKAEKSGDSQGAQGSGQSQLSFGSDLVRRARGSQSTGITAEQNILAQLIDQKQWEQSLFQFEAAFESDLGRSTGEKALSPNASALKQYLLFQNGLQLTGLEGLLSQVAPDQLDSVIADLWRETAPDTHSVWSAVSPSVWNAGWSAIFGIGAEMRLKGRQVYNSQDIASLKDLIKKTTVDTRERAWLTWQLVLAQAQVDELGAAGKALALLMKMPNNPVSSDLMTTTAARMLFQSGFLDAALKYYKMVPKKSDDWFDVQEEMGWTYLRKAEPQNAIAVSRSLSAEHFRAFVGPEAHFMAALAQLKVCDYGSVYEGLQTFKNRFKPRAERMLLIASGDYESQARAKQAVDRYIEKSATKTLKLTELGEDSDWLPRFVTRDEVLLWLTRSAAVHAVEAVRASDLHSRSVSGGSAKVGFQGAIAELSDRVGKKARAATAAAYGRLKQLAADEVTEIREVLSKMHIVEAEMIQQMALVNQQLSGNSKIELQKLDKAGTTGSVARDRLRFPASKEVWFDEYANFKVDVKRGCAAVKTSQPQSTSAQ